MPEVVDHVAVARLYGEPLFALPQDLYIPPDALEVALLNPDTRASLVGSTGLSHSDAFFNLQSNGSFHAASGVSVTDLQGHSLTSLDLSRPVRVSVDLAGIAAGSRAALYFDLLGFGALDSTVRIDDVRIVTTATPDDLPPVARTDSASVDEDGTVLIDVLANDSDPEGQELSLVSPDGATHGSLAIEAGQVRYTPQADWFGDDAFGYVVRDAAGNTATGSVAVTVRSVNDLPLARPDSATLDEDGSVLIDVLGNDADPENGPLSFVEVGTPTHGRVLVEAGKLRYTPDADWHGSDRFQYTVADALGATASAVVELTVTAVNDAPTLAPIADAQVNEGEVFSLNAVGQDADGDVLGYALDAAPAGASIDPATGAIRWTAIDGTAAYAFTVRVSDAAGASATRSFTVNVANLAPTLSAGGLQAVHAGEAFTLELASSDPGEDTITTWRIDWGDGQVIDYSGNPGQLTHTYSGVLGKVLIRASATDEDGSYALDPLEIAVLPLPLQVRDFRYDDNGFAVRFNDPFDASVINTYDSNLAGLGIPDILLSGVASGVVKGSVVFDADGRGLRYVVNGGGLAADSYSLVLKSGPAAFHSAFGNLDGNGDGTGGDDYLAAFTLGPVPALRLSLPDFMRGPGQAVNVPATASLLPLTLTSAGDVQNRILMTERAFTHSQLVEAANFLNAHYAGLAMDEVRLRLKTEVDALRGEISSLMVKAVDAGSEAAEAHMRAGIEALAALDKRTSFRVVACIPLLGSAGGVLLHYCTNGGWITK